MRIIENYEINAISFTSLHSQLLSLLTYSYKRFCCVRVLNLVIIEQQVQWMSNLNIVFPLKFNFPVKYKSNFCLVGCRINFQDLFYEKKKNFDTHIGVTFLFSLNQYVTLNQSVELSLYSDIFICVDAAKEIYFLMIGRHRLMQHDDQTCE